MKPLLALLALFTICTTTVFAQMPQCDKVYLLEGKHIYAYDPSLPLSSSNPVLNTITAPDDCYGLTVGPPLDGSSTVSSFYASGYTATSNKAYYYYNGSSWVNIGISLSVNTATGGGYLFEIVSTGGMGEFEVYRFDGTTNTRLIQLINSSIVYDIVADCEGNFYILDPTDQTGFLRKYDSSGTLLQSWNISNPYGYRGDIAFGMIGNRIFFEKDKYMYKGTIGATTVTIDAGFVQLSEGSSDYGTCPSTVGVIPPQATINASQNNICNGTPVTFNAAISSGTVTSYQWKVNGVNVGSSNSSYTYVPVNGDEVVCIIRSNSRCNPGAVSPSNKIIMVVTAPDTGSVSIRNLRNAFCPGVVSEIVATPVNGGQPFYQWYKNGMATGTNTALYQDSTLQPGDKIHVVMTPAGICTLNLPVWSDTITIMMSGTIVVPGININTNPPVTLCAGVPVTFISNDVGGGLHPEYKWYKNGSLLSGVTSKNHTEANPATGDTLMVILISSEACPVTRETPSNKMGINVHPVLVPQVTLSASPGTAIAPGQYVTFNAAAVNGGVSPAYTWYKNGVIVANVTTSTWVTNNLQHGDEIKVQLVSNVYCPSPVAVVSNSLKISIGTNAIAGVAADDEVVSIYPNPNAGTMMVRLYNKEVSAKQVSIEVFNTIGQQVFIQQQAIRSGENKLPVSLSNSLADGCYMLRMNTGAGVFSKLFVVKK